MKPYSSECEFFERFTHQSPAIDRELEWLLRFGIFSGVARDSLRLLLDGAVIVNHGPGEYLFQMGDRADHFGFVLTGAYKLVLTDSSGQEVIMHFGVRGEPLGVMSTMEVEHDYPFDFVSMTESRFLLIPRAVFFEHWISNSTIMLRYQNSLQGRIFRSHDEKRLQHRPLAERIANLLLYLSESKSSRSGVVEIPITRREIAAYVGSTVESVIRTLSEWGRRGLIDSQGRSILIQDRSTLEGIQAGLGRGLNFSGLEEKGSLAAIWQTTEVNAARNPRPPMLK